MAEKKYKALPKFEGNQLAAISPGRQVRLSASAGTGKTQVLVARVLRLLLGGSAPDSILCLTFTKAGASEMAERVQEKLSEWVTVPDRELYWDLENLGHDPGPAGRDHARNLLAQVLDARGSGLRIQTIHSFCQTLLAGFPAEAGLPPGFRPAEGREEQQLEAKALSDLVERAQAEGQLGLIDRLRKLSLKLGEDKARIFLKRCGAASDAMKELGSGIEAQVRRWLSVGDADVDAMILAGCTDGGFDRAGLDQIKAANLAWGTGRGLEKVEAITDWLAMATNARVEHILVLTSAWSTKTGEFKSFIKGHSPQVDGYQALVEAQYAHFNGLIELRRLAQTASDIGEALVVGQAFARAYDDAKLAAGVVDFNDLIRHTVKLLKTPGIGDWLRFKLDQAVDHILVDEAQDTNAKQWEIVKEIAEDFFAGEGAKPDRVRTLFMVGDHKQAIFGFQGTNPKEFNYAASYFARLAQEAGQSWHELPLSESYRSSQPILDLTDAVISNIGFENMGLETPPPQHKSALKGSGSVTLIPPINSAPDEDDEGRDEENWLATSELKWAEELANLVSRITKGGLRLRNQDRDAEPGDVMILVRSRGELARLIVSRLYEAKVAVAGVDRLRLDAPLAVQDLLACIRFALQPEDDLSLAELLVSPIIGWSQDDLYRRSVDRNNWSLWHHLGDDKPEALQSILARADLLTPYRFLEWILSGPIRGRQKLVARLGEEARDPINELLNAALSFEQDSAPSLQVFLDWFDRGDVEIKRDPSKPENAVRVMTVHAAKGLQAPVVILADATSDPKFKRRDMMDWVPEEAQSIPLFRPGKSDLVGSLEESAMQSDAREDQEHWRLLYVAMTRAEEHLYVGGALKPSQQKSGMSERCWHSQVEMALTNMGVPLDDQGQLSLSKLEAPRSNMGDIGAAESFVGEMPNWATTSAPAEAKPPRPLAPSALEAVDDEASPPPDPKRRAAAVRGVRLHSLIERLPAVPASDRRNVALRWLEVSAGVTLADERVELVESALSVVDDPRWSILFSSAGQAEVPLAGVVDGRVIAGTVDRLLISEDEILVVDFKTGRFVPSSVGSVSKHHLAQMAAYAAVLRGIFPGRKVTAALLYSSGPKLIEVPQDILLAYKPGFSARQEDLAVAS